MWAWENPTLEKWFWDFLYEMIWEQELTEKQQKWFWELLEELQELGKFVIKTKKELKEKIDKIKQGIAAVNSSKRQEAETYSERKIKTDTGKAEKRLIIKK